MKGLSFFWGLPGEKGRDAGGISCERERIMPVPDRNDGESGSGRDGKIVQPAGYSCRRTVIIGRFCHYIILFLPFLILFLFYFANAQSI